MYGVEGNAGDCEKTGHEDCPGDGGVRRLDPDFVNGEPISQLLTMTKQGMAIPSRIIQCGSNILPTVNSRNGERKRSQEPNQHSHHDSPRDDFLRLETFFREMQGRVESGEHELWC